MKKLFAFLLLTLCLSAHAQSFRIQATITVTNSPYNTNGNSLTVNGDKRTWTNATPGAAYILEDPSTNVCATNLFNAIAAFPFAGPLKLNMSAANALQLTGGIGQALSVSLATNWGSVSYYTNTTAPGTPLVIPVSSEIQSTTAVFLASGVVSAVNALATNAFGYQVLPQTVLSNNEANALVLGNQVIISGTNLLVLNSNGNTASITIGGLAMGGTSQTIIANPAGLVIGGLLITGGKLSGAWLSSSTLSTPISTNLSESSSLTVATNVTAGGTNSAAYFTNSALNFGVSPTLVTESNVVILANVNVAGTNNANNSLVTNNLAVLGITYPTYVQSASFTGTNNWTGDVAYPGVSVSSLANGNNAGIVISTNTYMRLSGPTGAFTLCGISGGRDGREIILENATGQTMSVANNSGVDSTAANRILTGTGTTVNSANNPGLLRLIYDGNQSKWVIVSCSN